MKSAYVIVMVAIACAIFNVAASAQSGTPSKLEASSSRGPSVAVQPDHLPISSYATYLQVVHGLRREDAITLAKNSADDVPAIRPESPELGSYAKYLMVVDGKSPEAAADAACSVDLSASGQRLTVEAHSSHASAWH